MITIKLFKTLLVVIPCLIIAVLVIVALPDRENYVIDVEGDLDAFGKPEDEPEYVTNSDMSFFYKKDQLETYREQRRAEKTTYFRMSDRVVSTDFTKNSISILPRPELSYGGPSDIVVTDDGIEEFVAVTDDGYTLKSGKEVSKDNAFEVLLDSGVIGSSFTTPYRLKRGQTYYAAFTDRLESVYFVLDSGNEFVSISVGGLSGRVEYTLLNSRMEPIKNGWNNSKDSMEIQYRGSGGGLYYLKLTGSYSEQLAPFTVSLPSDGNEWNWQMVYTPMGEESSGVFDYYGDEDFFVLPPEATSNINKTVLRFTEADFDINVVVYDKDRNAIGQYVYIPGKTDVISMYGLDEAYAVSVYSCNGSSSGARYAFVLEHTDITVLDIETFGFALYPEFTADNDYYTATVSSIKEKRITDVMHSQPSLDVAVKITQQCGKTVSSGIGQDLDLAPGRNTVRLTVGSGALSREIVIVISDRTYDLSYGYITADSAEVYEKPTVGSKSIATLRRGDSVLIIDDSGGNMTLCQLCGQSAGTYGYIEKSKIFSGYSETEMPSSYAPMINELKARHPNWRFTFVNTGWDYNTYVRSQLGASSVLNGKAATEADIRFYTDPRNFLYEQRVFMFEKQTYGDGVYSASGVKSIWNDDTYAAYIMEAGQSTGLSPYFIAARAALESGRGTSPLSMGTVTGYEGFYNFYGIGAYDSNPTNGAVFAKNSSWNSKRRAIIEGAAWVKDQYISRLQYSAYFMKFCFIPNREWHQYMTDIEAPMKDAQNYYKAHAEGGTLNGEIEFVIPVFYNMP